MSLDLNTALALVKSRDAATWRTSPYSEQDLMQHASSAVTRYERINALLSAPDEYDNEASAALRSTVALFQVQLQCTPAAALAHLVIYNDAFWNRQWATAHWLIDAAEQLAPGGTVGYWLTARGEARLAELRAEHALLCDGTEFEPA